MCSIWKNYSSQKFSESLSRGEAFKEGKGEDSYERLNGENETMWVELQCE